MLVQHRRAFATPLQTPPYGCCTLPCGFYDSAAVLALPPRSCFPTARRRRLSRVDFASFCVCVRSLPAFECACFAGFQVCWHALPAFKFAGMLCQVLLLPVGFAGFLRSRTGFGVPAQALVFQHRLCRLSRSRAGIAGFASFCVRLQASPTFAFACRLCWLLCLHAAFAGISAFASVCMWPWPAFVTARGFASIHAYAWALLAIARGLCFFVCVFPSICLFVRLSIYLFVYSFVKKKQP